MKKVLFLLGELRDIDIEWLIANGQRRAVRADEVLIRQGQPLDALFLVLDGTLEVSGGGGMPFLLGCGEVVGEISFVDSRPPTATVKALEDAIVLAVPRAVLRNHLDEDVEFAARFYRSLAIFLAHRFRHVNRLLGYGKGQPLPPDSEDPDELSTEVLDSLHKAGTRFDRVLQRLLSR